MALWDLYELTILFGVVYALFALSTHAALWGGMLSLASGVFGAVAGYCVTGVAGNFGLPLVCFLFIGAALGVLAALLVTLVLIRLDSHWFALGTVAMLLITRVVIINIPATGGTVGLVVPLEVGPIHVVGSLLVCGYLFARIRRSRLGLAAEAVRRDANVAASLGIQVGRVRMSVMALSGGVAGIAGVLFAGLTGYITPDTFYVDLAFVMLAGTVFGGAYYWPGAIVGGFVFGMLPDLLQSFFGEGQDFVNGFLLLIVILFLPNGVVDQQGFRRLWSRHGSRLVNGNGRVVEGVTE